MTPKERQDYATRFLIQRFAELTVETPGKVTFTVETGPGGRLIWTHDEFSVDEFSVTVELTPEVFVRLQKDTRYLKEKALFEPGGDMSFTPVRQALGYLMLEVKALVD